MLKVFNLKVSIVGSGYVGLVAAACFSEMGNQVVCVDVDSQKIEKLKAGVIPIYEPGLSTLVSENFTKGSLEFTTEISEALSIAEVVRDEGYACEIFYGSNNLSKQLKYSDKRKASLVIIIGEDEIKNKTISIKNLTVGKELSKNIDSREEWKELKAGQFIINKDDLITELKKILG